MTMFFAMEAVCVVGGILLAHYKGRAWWEGLVLGAIGFIGILILLFLPSRKPAVE
jgi:hypothetical protein